MEAKSASLMGLILPTSKGFLPVFHTVGLVGFREKPVAGLAYPPGHNFQERTDPGRAVTHRKHLFPLHLEYPLHPISYAFLGTGVSLCASGFLGQHQFSSSVSLF